jgi:hypothetical protein
VADPVEACREPVVVDLAWRGEGQRGDDREKRHARLPRVHDELAVP